MTAISTRIINTRGNILQGDVPKIGTYFIKNVMDENKLKEGYIITNINIYNGYALFPKYDKTSSNNITFISVKLSDNIMNYLKDYYNSKAR